MHGDEKLYHGQAYRLVGYRPHVCRDGRESELEIWHSHCAECGEPFECMRPVRSLKPFAPSRRCHEHAAPGRKVAKRKR